MIISRALVLLFLLALVPPELLDHDHHGCEELSALADGDEIASDCDLCKIEFTPGPADPEHIVHGIRPLHGIVTIKPLERIHLPEMILPVDRGPPAHVSIV
jgi:hypothetical protein